MYITSVGQLGTPAQITNTNTNICTNTNMNTSRNMETYTLQGWDGWAHMTKTPVGASTACADFVL